MLEVQACMNGLTQPDQPGESAPMSFGSRFAGIFFSPPSTFADVARAPGFVAPLVVLVVSSVAVAEAMLWKIGAERLVRMLIEQSGRAGQMSLEQMEQAVHRGASILSVALHVAGVLGEPIFLLFIAALGLGILYAVFGAEAGFEKVFSAVCYAALVMTLRTPMALAMIFFGDPERFNLENPAPTNPGFFLSPTETSKPLMVLASSLDFVTLWFLLLLGVGLSEATGKRVGWVGIFLAYGALWMIFVVGRIGLAFLF